MDLDIFKAIGEHRERLVLATTVDVKGSSPRHPGTKMLLGERSGRLGTIGGGRGEALGLEACQRCLANGRPELLRVEMLGVDPEGTDMICGGVHTVLIEPVHAVEPYRVALARLSQGRPVLLAKRLVSLPEGGPRLEVAVFDESGAAIAGDLKGLEAATAAQLLAAGQPCFSEDSGTFCEPLFPEEKLLILGGGHVGQALAAAACPLGFRVTLVDDRAEMLADLDLPPGVRTLSTEFGQAIATFPWDAATYAVVVTRSHTLDLECLRALLPRTYRYAGFMGSSRKTRFLVDQLLQDGFDQAKVDALWGPIGLDIGAETPEELAVAILGELISVRRHAKSLPALAAKREERRSGSRGTPCA